MAWEFLEMLVGNDIDTDPHQMYYDIQQEFVSAQFDNTSAKFTVKEQAAIGSDTYNDIDVWMTWTVEDTATNLKNSGDYCKYVFESLDHTITRGLMYQFDNNYWLTINYNQFNGLVQDCGVRRCNNALRMVDPDNGAVFSIPCCVDYDMAASNVQVTNAILTPNNHAVVMVQGNEDTLRLFKTNTRFLLSGRPFKLYGYQNTVEQNLTNTNSTLLYLDLYLDEICDGDNLTTGVAYNGEYSYALTINSTALTKPNATVGQLIATVTLNGEEVTKTVVWGTSDENVATITSSGQYTVVGEAGETCNLYAYVDGNINTKKQVALTVGTAVQDIQVVTYPNFNKVRQYQTVPFVVYLYVDGVRVDNITTTATTYSSYLNIEDNDGVYSISTNGITSYPQVVSISATSETLGITKSGTFNVTPVSMLG